ncbi:VOC family protein [Nocardia jejuensis]|uniref:VOC family protein n=1 Tax=Nocardia jejuensis TaxID=328049 RepID=UPI00082A95EF|nr:VOC family protein [Nocardia jejuensis]
MAAVNPYLLFNGNAEEAFVFYQSVLGGELMLVRFGEMGDSGDLPDEVSKLIAHAALPLGESILMASDCPPDRAADRPENPPFTVSLDLDSADEVQRVFDALSAGGQVSMPVGKTEWAESFAMLTDRFGVPWMVGYSPQG